MAGNTSPSNASATEILGWIAPGRAALLKHQRADFPGDLIGGLSVAAVAPFAAAASVSGITLPRFNAPIVFFNAPYCKREVLAAAGRKTGWSLWAESHDRALRASRIPIYVTLSDAINAYRSSNGLMESVSEFRDSD